MRHWVRPLALASSYVALVEDEASFGTRTVVRALGF